ncbi:SWIb domain-containing protein [Zea mays]|uniref:SWIb domain-containing protein n=1 Tax=Zea mays TaxID=4577 RepID=A0A1D6EBB8_MAIZE|nr:SWIb domain-containing protein [Zea mays]
MPQEGCGAEGSGEPANPAARVRRRPVPNVTYLLLPQCLVVHQGQQTSGPNE